MKICLSSVEVTWAICVFVSVSVVNQGSIAGPINRISSHVLVHVGVWRVVFVVLVRSRIFVRYDDLRHVDALGVDHFVNGQHVAQPTTNHNRRNVQLTLLLQTLLQLLQLIHHLRVLLDHLLQLSGVHWSDLVAVFFVLCHAVVIVTLKIIVRSAEVIIAVAYVVVLTVIVIFVSVQKVPNQNRVIVRGTKCNII